MKGAQIDRQYIEFTNNRSNACWKESVLNYQDKSDKEELLFTSCDREFYASDITTQKVLMFIKIKELCFSQKKSDSLYKISCK